MNDSSATLLLIQENIRDKDSNSEKEKVVVSPDDVLKSLQIWITFFEQQPIDKFHVEDINLFKRYFKIVK
ncbi:hypothetical protein C1645_831179 [Glomus cerebriforme]|uniref:Uncharacterized protein n=1 Tax=Glomus cerebriforme TaxID=658196 RepID=A0A397SHX2_9GLOM|nr:hypothetical protein C1645_831179 [Glomus cerebriforme]